MAEILLAVLAFFAGAVLGFAAGVLRRQGALPLPTGKRKRRMQIQFENFLNYDGSERGQRSLGDGEFSEGDF